MYAFPRLGKISVSEITSADVLETLFPIWHAKPKVARLVRMRIGAVLEWAVAMEWRKDNPCDRLPAREHRVPLSGRALEVLDEARKLGDGVSPLVFVSERGQRLHRKRLGRLLQRCGIAAVPHGFRSSFRDWAAERTDHPREVIEAALAHADGSLYRPPSSHLAANLFGELHGEPIT